MTSPLNDALAADGILSRRLHPALIGRIDAAVKRGELVPLFPGTYAPARSFHSLVAALADWDPNAVLMAASAARLSWWPNLDDDLVRAATTRRPVRRVPGTKLSLIPIPAELVAERGGLRIQHPAASTLDLAREIGPAAIDEALRRRAVSLGELRDAFELMTWRTGNPQLAAWLRASRDGAWSHLERDAHALLHAARITGWKANYEVRARGRLHFIDVAFPGAKLAVELDGWKHHGDRRSFIDDRQRDNRLRLAGWTPLHFTAESLPTMVPTVRRMLAILADAA